MRLATWDDGYVFDVDPRHEVPLYYYLRDGGWGAALGVQVDPLYEEHTATAVTIRVFPEHLSREAAMAAAERIAMYGRIVSVLLARFPKWSRVTLQSDYLPEDIAHGSLSAAFATAGFAPTRSSTSHERTWIKA